MLRARKYRIVFETGLVLVAIRVGLRLVSLPRLLRWLTLPSANLAQDVAAIQDIAYYTDRWLELFPYNPKGNCFPRSLTLYWFARRFGFPVRFQCGVARLNGRLEGHAWLMSEDKEFCEPSRYWRSFAVTVSFPPELAEPSRPSSCRSD
jgi:hypothetical protein